MHPGIIITRVTFFTVTLNIVSASAPAVCKGETVILKCDTITPGGGVLIWNLGEKQEVRFGELHKLGFSNTTGGINYTLVAKHYDIESSITRRHLVSTAQLIAENDTVIKCSDGHGGQTKIVEIMIKSEYTYMYVIFSVISVLITIVTKNFLSIPMHAYTSTCDSWICYVF